MVLNSMTSMLTTLSAQIIALNFLDLKSNCWCSHTELDQERYLDPNSWGGLKTNPRYLTRPMNLDPNISFLAEFSGGSS